MEFIGTAEHYAQTIPNSTKQILSFPGLTKQEIFGAVLQHDGAYTRSCILRDPEVYADMISRNVGFTHYTWIIDGEEVPLRGQSTEVIVRRPKCMGDALGTMSSYINSLLTNMGYLPRDLSDITRNGFITLPSGSDYSTTSYFGKGLQLIAEYDPSPKSHTLLMLVFFKGTIVAGDSGTILIS